MFHSENEIVWHWIRIGFVLRLTVCLLIHFTGADRSLELTKDAFLYDDAGYGIAQYWWTGDPSYWPARADGLIDSGWEYFVGSIYYVVGHEPLVVKLICVVVGSLTPLLHYRMTLLATGLPLVARNALVLSVFFPTQVYYSGLMVRDSLAVFGIALVFLGLTEWLTHGSNTWWMKLGFGFLIMLGLRSYVTVVLAATIPVGLLMAAIAAPGVQQRKLRAFFGCMIIGVALAGAIYVAPHLIDEVDTQFTDVDYINKIRGKMNTGSGAFYSSGGVMDVGDSIVDSVTGLMVGLYFFFFSINPATISSIRQVMAIPEVIVVAVGSVYTVKGIRVFWTDRRDVLVALMVPTLVLTFGYSVATTNGGPLMRWRMQLIGVYLIFAATGLVASRLRKSQSSAIQHFDP